MEGGSVASVSLCNICMYVHHSGIVVTCCLKEWCVSPDELSQDVHQDGVLVVCYSSETGVLGSASKQDVAVLCTCVLQKHQLHRCCKAYAHMYIRTQIHTYIHTYVHTYIHITCIFCLYRIVLLYQVKQPIPSLGAQSATPCYSIKLGVIGWDRYRVHTLHTALSSTLEEDSTHLSMWTLFMSLMYWT